jgi:TonB family protein
MTRIVLTVITFFAAICTTAQTPPSAIQGALEKQFKGKIVTLREFYPDEDVQFTPEGHYKGKSNPGPWTLWSRVKIRGIKVEPDSVTLQGLRVYVFYDAKRKQFRNKEGEEKNWVTIEFASGALTLASAQTALAKILLSDDEHMSDLVPEEWKEFLKSNEEHRDAPHLLSKEEGDVLKVKAGVTPPRPIYDPNPAYQPEARRARLKGTVLVWAVVDEEGRVSTLRIVRPLGIGLDDRAVDAIRLWKFEPAKKDGNPVKVQLNIEVHFELTSW